jgi:hypothetical protein
MKKVVAVILIITCSIGLYLAYLNKRVDPKVELVESIRIMKYQSMVTLEGVYIEKDTKKIKKILNALKDRRRDTDIWRSNNQNYTIEILLKDKNKSSNISYSYDIWIEKDKVFITTPTFSDKSYKLYIDSAKLIQEYLSGVNFSLK